MRRIAAFLFLLSATASADPRVGDTAPPLDLPVLSGARVTLDRVTIVDFAATWCGPCHEALAQLEAIARAHEVSLVIVDVEEPAEKVRAFFADHPLPKKTVVALDLDGQASTRWGRHRFPTTFLIDHKGIIRFINRGYGPGYHDRIDQKLRTLLDTP